MNKYLPKLFLLTNILKANFSSKPNLYRLNLFVTYKCNFKCKACFIWKKEITNELSLSEYKKILSKVNVNWISVSGGEIFLRDDMTEIFSAIIESQKRLAFLNFSTNGSFMNKTYDLVNYILTHSRSKLMVGVSLDGPEKTHNFIRGVDAWRKSVNTYKKLRQLENEQFNVMFSYTVSNFNHDKIDETVEILKNEIPGFTYSDLHINIAHTSEHYYENSSLEIDKKAIMSSVDRYMSKRAYSLFNPVDYLEKRYHLLVKKYLTDDKTPLKCRDLIDSVFVSPEGDVFPCTIYNKNLGSLRENDYDINKIVNSKQVLALRKEIEMGNCPNCWTPCEAYQMILASLFKRS